MKVVNYCVMWGDGDAFVRRVCGLIAEGWQPQGGVAVRPTGFGGVTMFQAMVKYETMEIKQ